MLFQSTPVRIRIHEQQLSKVVLRCCPSGLQARATCAARYLGARANDFFDPVVSLHSMTDQRALLKWQVTVNK
jgi:hypothetical protein